MRSESNSAVTEKEPEVNAGRPAGHATTSRNMHLFAVLNATISHQDTGEHLRGDVVSSFVRSSLRESHIEDYTRAIIARKGK
jgi:hypothetical protein